MADSKLRHLMQLNNNLSYLLLLKRCRRVQKYRKRFWIRNVYKDRKHGYFLTSSRNISTSNSTVCNCVKQSVDDGVEEES